MEIYNEKVYDLLDLSVTNKEELHIVLSYQFKDRIKKNMIIRNFIGDVTIGCGEGSRHVLKKSFFSQQFFCIVLGQLKV